MARIRTIKPDFFRHEMLYDAERLAGLPLRLAFAGLWTACDREGRFKWAPRALKLDCLPFDECDFGQVLDALATHGFVIKYQVGNETFGYVPSWSRHQHVNVREAASAIPAPTGDSARTCENIPARGEGKGKEQEGKGKEVERSQARAAPSKPVPEPDAESFTANLAATGGKLRRATRWPPDAVVPDGWLEMGARRRAQHGKPAIDLRLEAEQFANYYAAKSGGDAARMDWQKTWVNWCLKAYENGNGSRQSRGNQHPFGPFGAMLEREIDEGGRAEGDDAPDGGLRIATRSVA